jgi:hypothetical protein
MAITVKHKFVSAVPDSGDTDIVQPSNWNDDHDLVGTIPVANGGTGASTLTGYVKGNGTSTMTASSTIPNTDITGLGTASTRDAGSANGVATLDAGGKVPVSELPAAVLGALSYQGTWNASTNTPTLTSSTGTKGYYYVVSVAGSTNLDGITDWLVGDWAVYNGTVWQKVDNTEAVTSVNGQTGAVTLTTTNIAEGTNEYFTTARARASVSAGTGISYDNATGVITNSLPSLGGDVVGPSSATDNAVARYDSTTGKLLQNSVVTVGDSGAVSGVTTLTASTSVTTPIVQASNSGGLSLKNSAGTTQISMGGGGGDNVTIAVATNINGANAQIDISPTGTGHVHIKPTGTGSLEIAPTNVGTIDNMTIGGTTARAITGTTITATSFVGSGASLTNVVNSLTASTGISVSGSTGAVTVTNTAPDQTVSISGGTGISTSGTYPNFTVTNTAPDQTVVLTAGTGISTSGTYPNFTITNTSPSTGGTVTSVGGTGTVNGITLSGTVTSSGNLTLGGTLSGVDLTTQVTGTLPVANGGTGLTSLTANRVPYGNGTSALGNEADFTYDPSLNTLTAPQLNASNGIIVNSNTVSANYSIPSGSSAMSAGPMTVANGITVTIASGSRWVVL